jgi:hypothetical protein
VESSAAGPVVDTSQPEAPALAELFTPKQIMWCSLLLSPVAGAVLCAFNLRGLGRSGGVVLVAAVMALFGGAWITDVLLAANEIHGFFGALSQPVMAAGIAMFANRSFARSIRYGNRRPTHVAVGISFLTVIAFAIAFVIAVGVLITVGPDALRDRLNAS